MDFLPSFSATYCIWKVSCIFHKSVRITKQTVRKKAKPSAWQMVNMCSLGGWLAEENPERDPGGEQGSLSLHRNVQSQTKKAKSRW
jgi:hypothetical protein